jgi:hypothetical protein
MPYRVLCHEWIQIEDGTIDAVPLSADLSAATGNPRTLFHATDAQWTRCRADIGELFLGRRYHASITDGPWLHRTKTGRLVMLWSSYGRTGMRLASRPPRAAGSRDHGSTILNRSGATTADTRCCFGRSTIVW